MNEKNLRKLSRRQLLELLLAQTERADLLEAQLKEVNDALSERKIIEMESGSVAEASIKLNGVFEAAQAAADQYLENVKLRLERAEAEAEAIIAEAHAKAAEREKQAEEKIEGIKAQINALRSVCQEFNNFYLKATYVDLYEQTDEKEN